MPAGSPPSVSGVTVSVSRWSSGGSTPVALRPVVAGDEPWFQSLAADPAVVAYVGDGRPWSPQKASRRFAQGLRATNSASAGGWWVILTPSGHATTTSRAGLVTAEKDRQGALEIGIWVDPRWWGRGLAKGALRELVNTLPRRLTLVVHVDRANTRSMRLLRTAGFQESSVLPQASTGPKLIRMEMHRR